MFTKSKFLLLFLMDSVLQSLIEEIEVEPEKDEKQQDREDLVAVGDLVADDGVDDLQADEDAYGIGDVLFETDEDVVDVGFVCRKNPSAALVAADHD